MEPISSVLDLVKEIIEAINKVKGIYDKFSGECNKLKKTLGILKCRINEVRQFDEEMADENATDELTIQRRKEMQDLAQTLNDCKILVDKCLELSHWNSCKVNDYANRLSGYNEILNEFITVNMIADVWVQTMTAKPIEKNYGSALPEPGFTVGWQAPVIELKKKLLQENVFVIGSCGIGGCGKTALVIKLCEQIKDQSWKIIFLPVSKSSDMMELIRRLWVDLVDSIIVPKFLSVDDALSQLRSHVPDRKSNNSTVLVVLDDVWEEHVLEKLLIVKPGFRTIVTSRVKFKNKCNWTYRVPQLYFS